MEKENSLMWCYVGENKDQVMMTCSREEWETICKALDWVRHQKNIYIPSESDDWNYSYTGFDRRI